MLNFLQMLILAQNVSERRYTVIMLAVLILFLFTLVLDSVAKNKLIPKKDQLEVF